MVLPTEISPKNEVPEIDLGLFQICCIYIADINEEPNTNLNTTQALTSTTSFSLTEKNRAAGERQAQEQRECVAWQTFYNAENQTSPFGDTNCPRYGSLYWLHWPEDLVFVISSMAVVTSFFKLAFCKAFFYNLAVTCLVSLSYLPVVVRSNMFFVVGLLNLSSIAFQVFVCVGWTIVVSQTEDDEFFEGTLKFSIVFCRSHFSRS